MKKILVLTSFLSLIGFSQAQNQKFTVSNLDGVEYENNSVHVFNVFGDMTQDVTDDIKLYYVLKNVGNDTIIAAGEVIEMTNADGEMAQFCFGGDCYYPVVKNYFYPNGGAHIAPGEVQSMYDYFANFEGGSDVVEYKFRFLQLDANGQELPNTSFYLTYRYEKNMGVSDVSSSISIAEVAPTVAKDFTTVHLKEDAKTNILSATGQLLKTVELKAGKSNLSLAGFAKGIYYLQFNGVSGKTTTSKILVK
ncbi:T9SS type A sorting domain-containing protein [Weeksella virosa]|uniref:T9SS type A sorting domain-containing protein n=1 Tax=Weeksella virosa TaxID=1014 RepID=UPI000E00F7D5|nr:T9SS type A sorting domain-containing protein [Weeksella virosa]MDK7374985.1 T9SS type A sorting domain-containing protein [Weeksella virosa]SUP53444.1 Por secretion system C-terminal sorting domain [Weeksella virosa]